MLQDVATKSLHTPSAGWRKFAASIPAPDATVEIRRLHDDKSIIRRRADLPASFDWRHARWRPI